MNGFGAALASVSVFFVMADSPCPYKKKSVPPALSMNKSHDRMMFLRRVSIPFPFLVIYEHPYFSHGSIPQSSVVLFYTFEDAPYHTIPSSIVRENSSLPLRTHVRTPARWHPAYVLKSAETARGMRRDDLQGGDNALEGSDRRPLWSEHTGRLSHLAHDLLDITERSGRHIAMALTSTIKIDILFARSYSAGMESVLLIRVLRETERRIMP